MKLIISDKVKRKVTQWVHAADFEVSGLGIVEIIDDIPVVTEVFLLEQEVSKGDTELNAEAVAKLEYEVRNMKGELRWWWHSHNTMGVFWSGTDKDTIKQLGKEDWYYHTVFNKKGEFLSAFSCKCVVPHLREQGQLTHHYEDVKTEFLGDAEFSEFCKKEYDAKVKEKKNEVVVLSKEQAQGVIDKVIEKHSGLTKFEKERLDLKFKIYDLFEQGWTTTSVNNTYQGELRRFSLKLRDLKDDYEMYWSRDARQGTFV